MNVKQPTRAEGIERIWLEMTDAITAERSAELFEIEKGY